MSEYIVDTFGIVQDFADLHGDMSTPLYQAIMDVMISRQREEIVRCKDCKHAHSVFWPARDDAHDDWLDCTGPLVTTWDYYDDEPRDNPVRPDGFCAWGEKKVDRLRSKTEHNGVAHTARATDSTPQGQR